MGKAAIDIKLLTTGLAPIDRMMSPDRSPFAIDEETCFDFQ
jgi:hypothetical protein